MSSPLRILLIRRDNIGDLICTTPLLRALREHFPKAAISILVSSYNAEVLTGNRDIDQTFVFLKRRHDNHGYHPLTVIWKRWQLNRFLRHQNFDYILLANGGWRYARKLRGKVTIGFEEKNLPSSHQPDLVIPRESTDSVEEHEVSKLSRLGAVLGVPREKSLGPTHLFPQEKLLEEEQRRLSEAGWNPHKKTIGVHLSARCETRVWPEDYFINLLKKIILSDDCQILLFWSPGLQNNPIHPGDDEKALRVLNALKSPQVFQAPTTTISKLVVSISLVDQMICSDGGAMHIAAALKKPILAFFGIGSIESWHPWKTPHIALRSSSGLAKDISPEKAFEKFLELPKK